MAELASALSNLSTALNLAKEAYSITKNATSLQVEQQRTEIEIAAQKLRESTEMVQAQLANSFGYRLCKCTFPPQICLKVGFDESKIIEIHQCPNCKQTYKL